MVSRRTLSSNFLADSARIVQYRELLRNLVAKDLKLKYRGSALGFVWSLLNPLLMIVVYSIAIGFIMRVQNELEHYSLFLITGILHWGFFAASFLSATDAVTQNANLIHKINFPRMILPISAVAFQFVQMAVALAVFMIAYPWLGGKFWMGFLFYPLVLVLQGLMIIGLALGISALTVFYRDLKHLVEVGLMLLFWLTPIIYKFTMIPEDARIWFRFNPMLPFVISYHDLLYANNWPSLGNWVLMVCWSLLAVTLGYGLFRRLEDRFAEEL